jgi:hypothetical protein
MKNEPISSQVRRLTRPHSGRLYPLRSFVAARRVSGARRNPHRCREISNSKNIAQLTTTVDQLIQSLRPD